jgi:DMSO/TMAO reductase YedYZ molybdopterin-dependent catalytic subunit/F0F1-type ATP synthase assembly protein I
MAEENETAGNAPRNEQEARPPKTKGGAGRVKLIALVAIAALLIGVPLGYLATQGTNETPDGDVAIVISGFGDSVNLTVTDLADMPSYEGSGYYMKSTGTIVGPLNFTGVPVGALVDLVYEGDNYSLGTVAWDGYEMTYNSGQVENGTFPTYNLDGDLLGPDDLTMMLAYEEDGERLAHDSLRIVIVDDEETPVTDGHFWAKMVKELNVVQYVDDWTLELEGVTSMDMDRQTFESLASCYYHTLYYNYTDDDGDHSYEGVPLWVLLSAVDGGDAPDGHYMFNDALAEAGYTVNVTASDGYYGVFDAEQTARNDSIMVVYKLDGEVLAEDSWPLRIVGDGLPGSQKVRNIARIAIEGFVDTPAWELTLAGLTTATFTEWDFVSLFNCDEGLHVSYYNYTDDSVEHSYAGIPLWVLVGLVDGADSSHWLFNDTLAASGYGVKVTGSDGYNKTLLIGDVAYNDSLILALTFDGEYLTGDSYPVKLTGEGLPGSLNIKSVARIDLVDLPV